MNLFELIMKLLFLLVAPLFSLASGRLFGNDRHLETCSSNIACTSDKDCSDGIDCPYIEYCNTAVTGGCCEKRANPSCGTCTTDADCDDNDPCTAVDACENGACVYKDFRCTVPDGQCGKAYCENVSGTAQCTIDPISTCSADGDCEDGDRCTVNTCNLFTGCCETKDYCEDDVPCTVNTCSDVTDPPTCSFPKLICDDNAANPCILDECQDIGSGTVLGDGTCVTKFVAAGYACDDSANGGLSDGVCSGDGSCVQCALSSDCDDQNECTAEKCNTLTNTCVRVDADGAACGGGSGVCAGGACVATTTTTTTTSTSTSTTTGATTTTTTTTTTCKGKTKPCEDDNECCGGKCRGSDGGKECK